MVEILISYLAYNLILGVILSIIHLFRNGLKGSVSDRILLLLLPVIGLGYIRYAKDLELHKPLFPRKWFVLKYMIKIHWGFLILLVLAPVSIVFVAIAIMVFGLSTDLASSGFSVAYDIIPLIAAGWWLFATLASILLVIFSIIPYLILIHIPKTSKLRIERSHTTQTIPLEQPIKTIVKKPTTLFPAVREYVEACRNDFDLISSERKKELKSVADYISQKLADAEIVNLVFICTHNSRRSQFGQVWAAVAAAHFGIRNVNTYSGGTEETAFNKRAVEAVKRTGLKIEGTVSTNPRYSVRFSEEEGALDCYSKKFDSPSNPQQGFAAIMTCSDADENCPIIPGAEFRARLTYDDPKVADRTVEEAKVYDERCTQIATEMLYLFSLVE